MEMKKDKTLTENGKPYKLLVTGLPISGKTSLAKGLEEALSKKYSVSNKDIDYSEDYKTYSSDCDVYILQTPHGANADKEDGINLKDFDKILYIDPYFKEYLMRLTSRGEAWFKQGIVDFTKDKGIAKPYSPIKAVKIIREILRYLVQWKGNVRADIKKFKREELLDRVIFVKSADEGVNAGLEEVMGNVRPDF